MFDNNKMAQYLKSGRKPVEATPPAKSGLIMMSEAFKKIAEAEDKEACEQ